jgi:hypothetical protein
MGADFFLYDHRALSRFCRLVVGTSRDDGRRTRRPRARREIQDSVMRKRFELHFYCVADTPTTLMMMVN